MSGSVGISRTKGQTPTLEVCRRQSEVLLPRFGSYLKQSKRHTTGRRTKEQECRFVTPPSVQRQSLELELGRVTALKARYKKAADAADASRPKNCSASLLSSAMDCHSRRALQNRFAGLSLRPTVSCTPCGSGMVLWLSALLPASRGFRLLPGRRDLRRRHVHLVHRHHARLSRIDPKLLKDGHQRLPELVERRLRCPDIEHHQFIFRAKRRMVRTSSRGARPSLFQ